MPRPFLSQHATVEEFRTAFAAWHAKMHDFSEKVDARVEEQYDLTAGGDLCYNLLESGVIPEDASVDEAARIVAMHIQQA